MWIKIKLYHDSILDSEWHEEIINLTMMYLFLSVPAFGATIIL